MLPYHSSNAPSDNTINISCTWKNVTPQTMASRVTIPLEDALSMIDDIQEVNSSSGPGYANIQMTFHCPVTNKLLSKVLMQVRQIRKSLPEAMPFPVIEKGFKTPSTMIVAIGTGVRVVGNPGLLENKIIQFLGGMKGIHPALPLTADTSDYVYAARFSSSTSLGKSLRHTLENYIPEADGMTNLPIPHGKGMIHPTSLWMAQSVISKNEPARVNGFPALIIPLNFDDDFNPLVTRIMTFLQLNNLLKLLPGPHPFYTVVLDPYQDVTNNIIIRIGRMLMLFLLCVLLSPAFQKKVKFTFSLLLLPGIFLLFIWVSPMPLSDTALHWIEVTFVSGSLFIALSKVSTTNVGLGIIFAGILFLSCTPFLPPSFVSHALYILISVTTIILYRFFLPLGAPQIKPTSGHPLPWVSFGFLLFLTSPLFYGNSDANGIFQTVLENRKKLPPDPSVLSQEIQLTATISTVESHQELTLAVEAIRENINSIPTEYTLEYSPNESSYKIILRFKKHSPAQLLAVREQIIPLLSTQKGIQWQFEGIGEIFQNNHLIIPGTYGFRIKGFDYDQTLLIAQTLADSIKKLPGVGLVRVDQDEYSDNRYFVLRINPPGPFTDPAVLLHSLSERLNQRHPMKDSLQIQLATYSAGNKTFQGRQFLSFEEVIAPAPVKRHQRQFIAGINYTHFGGEKYASEFHKNQMIQLRKILPTGFEIHQESNHSIEKYYPHIFLGGMCLSCFCAMFLVKGQNRNAIFTCTTGLLVLVYIFCYLTGYPLSTPILMAFQTSLLFSFILISSGGVKLLQGMILIFLWAASCLFLNTSGAEYLFGQTLMVISSGLFIIILIEVGIDTLFSRRRNSPQKLFNLFRLGMVAQFFKRIDKVP